MSAPFVRQAGNSVIKLVERSEFLIILANRQHELIQFQESSISGERANRYFVELIEQRS